MGVMAERRLTATKGVCRCSALGALAVRGRSGMPSMGVNLKPGVVAVVTEPLEEAARPAADGVLYGISGTSTIAERELVW